MIYPAIPLAQLTLALCEQENIQHIVISPGSRNAPLTIGFTENTFFKTYSIVDERSAAFFALGLAQQTKEAVALVCTSGSALLNYYPAIAEAFYSRIPLVILSADRPISKIDIGDGQTIRQRNVYDNHILFSANCEEEDEAWLNNSELISKALQTAKVEQGPVHINLPFEEPLYETTTELYRAIPKETVTYVSPQAWDASILNEHFEAWRTASKKLVLVGVLSPNSIEQSIIDSLTSDPNVLILTETTSNLHGDKIVPSIDVFLEGLTKKQKEVLQPELLLTFGGLVVSKKIKNFLRNYPPVLHWHVDEHTALDTYHVMSSYFKTSAQEFLSNLLTAPLKVKTNYQELFWSFYQTKCKRRNEFTHQMPYSDFGVYKRIFSRLPEQLNLQLSNSATIRYAQLFELPKSVSVFCNRGTSGIDGSTSTAIGASLTTDRQTLLVTGDLSFFYDSNALWNNYVPNNFRIIVVNNGGGGIFRIIPGPKTAKASAEYFETQHKLNASYLADMFGFIYTSVDNYESLDEALSEFYFDAGFPKILEIFTPTELNEQQLHAFFKHVSLA